MENMKSDSLRNDLTSLLHKMVSITPNRIIITKQFSIDIVEQEPLSYTSYLYRSEIQRNSDLMLLEDAFQAYKNKLVN